MEIFGDVEMCQNGWVQKVCQNGWRSGDVEMLQKKMKNVGAKKVAEKLEIWRRGDV